MKITITILMIIAGIINIFPIIGVVSSTTVTTMYALGSMSSDIAILLRHRAILFGIIGGLMIYAAFKPQYQGIAFIFGFISMIAFLVLASMEQHGNGIRKVVIADIVAMVALSIAFGLWIVDGR